MSTSASAFGGFVAGLIALGTPDGGQSHGVGTRCLVSDLQASVAGRPRLLMSQWCLVARRALPFSITSPTSNRPRPSFRRPSPSATVMSPTAPDPTTSRCSRHRSKMGRPFVPPCSAQVGVRSAFWGRAVYWYGCPPGGGRIFVFGFAGSIACPPVAKWCASEAITGLTFVEQNGE